MIRRVILPLILLTLLRLPAVASGYGSATVRVEQDGQPVSGVQIQLYRVGTPVEGGYLLSESFGSGFLSDTDVLLPEVTHWLAQEAKTGMFLTTGHDGSVYFPELTEGLYLMTQYGPADRTGLFEPFLLMIPWDGYVWDVQVAPLVQPLSRNPDTSDPGTLVLGAWGIVLSGTGMIVLALSKSRFLCTSQICKKGYSKE